MYDLTGRPAACSPVRRRKDYGFQTGGSLLQLRQKDGGISL